MRKTNKGKKVLKKIVILFLMGCAFAYAQPRVRPVSWAQPVLETGLENLYQVDKTLYRSEQPEQEQFAELEKLGVTEVLSLREYHDDVDETENLPFTLHQLEIATGSLTPAQLTTALQVIKNRKGPLLVHCWHGSDRTGTVIAAYRIVFQGWSKAQAIDEMVQGGYGYHASIYPNLVELLQSLDVEKIKQELGVF